MNAPVHTLPLCDCADKGSSCLGRKEGYACMAHDKWYVRPCDEGKCPGPFHPHCCHKADPNALPDDDHGCHCY